MLSLTEQATPGKFEINGLRDWLQTLLYINRSKDFKCITSLAFADMGLNRYDLLGLILQFYDRYISDHNIGKYITEIWYAFTEC